MRDLWDPREDQVVDHSEMTAYLQTWTEGADDALERAGQRLIHTASNQYGRMGIRRGDKLFIAYLENRRLHLLGRLVVDRIVSQGKAERVFRRRVWDAEFHALGERSDVALFDLEVPRDVVEALESVRGEGTVTTLGVAADGTVDGRALQAIRRLTADSRALLDEVLDTEAPAPEHSAHFGEADPAVEERAMAVVRARYEDEGWTVEDVSAHRPYDLLCRRGLEEVHVEVKGLSGQPVRIQLTANEVQHAHVCGHVALAVVSEITGERSASSPTGATVDLYDPWQIDEGRLRPTAYSYALT
jgi:hypothetical protein